MGNTEQRVGRWVEKQDQPEENGYRGRADVPGFRERYAIVMDVALLGKKIKRLAMIEADYRNEHGPTLDRRLLANNGREICSCDGSSDKVRACFRTVQAISRDRYPDHVNAAMTCAEQGLEIIDKIMAEE